MSYVVMDPLLYLTPASTARVARHLGLALYELALRKSRPGCMPSPIREQEMLVARLQNLLNLSIPCQTRLPLFNKFAGERPSTVSRPRIAPRY